MPEVTEGKRTIMYSVAENGTVIRHKFPWDANNKFGMQKLQKMVAKGYSFTDPSLPDGLMKSPEVIVTDRVDLDKPEMVKPKEFAENAKDIMEKVEEEAPLYVSAKDRAKALEETKK